MTTQNMNFYQNRTRCINLDNLREEEAYILDKNIVAVVFIDINANIKNTKKALCGGILHDVDFDYNKYHGNIKNCNCHKCLKSLVEDVINDDLYD